MGDLAVLANVAPVLKRAARGMGRRICAAPGAGKTRIVARLLIPFDLLSGLPVIAIDPVGALSDDLLDTVERQPPWLQTALLDRIVYVDMAGQRIGGETYVHPFPFLYRTGTETPFVAAHRFLEVMERLHANLSKGAPIMGWAAVGEIGENVLMALAAMGCQISEAEDLLKHTARWEARLRQARAQVPEAIPAIDWLLETYLPIARADEKQRLTLSFLRVISPFNRDAVMRAQYGAARPSLTPREVVEQKQCVLFDFRGVVNAQQRRLGILWIYRYFNEYFRTRGPRGRRHPVAFYIDELSYLITPGRQRDALVADDLSELFSRTARNNGIFVTVIHQDLQQFDDATNDLLSRLGCQLIGAQADVEGAEKVAKRFFRYDPYAVKDVRRQYASAGRGHVSVIDQHNVYFSPQEQAIAHAYRFLDLDAFRFLVGVADREGQLATRLEPVSFAAFDAGNFPRADVVDVLRALLMRQQGRPVSAILREIDGRIGGAHGHGAAEEPPGDHADANDALPFVPTPPI